MFHAVVAFNRIKPLAGPGGGPCLLDSIDVTCQALCTVNIDRREAKSNVTE